MKKILSLMVLCGFSTISFSDDLSGWTTEMNTGTMQQQGCNQTVAKAIADSQAAVIDGRTRYADSLYQSILNNMSYRTASCLDSMIPNFSKGSFAPSASDIGSMLGNAACSYAQKMLMPSVGSYNSKISQGESFLTNKMQIPGVSGLNFGTVLGFQNQGINATSYLSNTYKQNVPNWNYTTNTSQIISTTSNALGMSDYTNIITSPANSNNLF